MFTIRKPSCPFGLVWLMVQPSSMQRWYQFPPVTVGILAGSPQCCWFYCRKIEKNVHHSRTQIDKKEGNFFPVVEIDELTSACQKLRKKLKGKRRGSHSCCVTLPVSLSLPVRISLLVYKSLPVYPCIYLRLSNCLYVSLPVCMSFCLSKYLSSCLSVGFSCCLSACPYISSSLVSLCLLVCISACLFVSLSSTRII